jgi:hypothetical protein
MVRLDQPKKSDPACSGPSCQAFLGLVDPSQIDLVLAPAVCDCNERCLSTGLRIVQPGSGTSLKDVLDTICPHRLGKRIRHRNMRLETFSVEILRPLFRPAKRLLFVDKMIGRSALQQVVESGGSHTWARFASGMLWLCEQVARWGHRDLLVDQDSVVFQRVEKGTCRMRGCRFPYGPATWQE